MTCFPPTSKRLTHRHLLVCVLGGLAIVHPLAWSRHPPDVDPVNFVAALTDFDPTHDRPHPPGYPLYVALARVAMHIVGTASAYQAVNLGLYLLLLGAIFLVARAYQQGEAGVMVVAVLATHPLLWAATTVQVTYIVDGAALALLLAVVAHRRSLGITRVAVLGGVILVCLGLVRAVSAPVLTPLLAYGLVSLAARGRKLRMLLLGSGIGLLAFVVGVATSAWLAGGVEAYREATDRVIGNAFREHSLLGGASLEAHLWMVSKLSAWLLALAVPALTPLAVFAMFSRPFSSRVLVGGMPAVREVALAAAPFVALYAGVYYLKPTYLIPLVVVLVVFGAWPRAGTRDGLMRHGAIIAAVCIGQVGFYWLGGESLPQPLYRLTRAYVVDQDERFDALRHRLDEFDSSHAFIAVRRMPPGVEFQALRLMHGDGKVGVMSSERGRAVEVYDGLFAAPTPLGSLASQGFRSVIVLDGTDAFEMRITHR